MAQSRLHVKDSALADAVATTDAAAQRQVAIAAALAAVNIYSTDDMRLTAGVQALRDARFGDVTVQHDLTSLVAVLDERYWEAEAQEQNGLSRDSEKQFSCARAANAVLFALGTDPLQAALEAVYEAQASLEFAYDGRVQEVVRHLLR